MISAPAARQCKSAKPAIYTEAYSMVFMPFESMILVTFSHCPPRWGFDYGVATIATGMTVPLGLSSAKY